MMNTQPLARASAALLTLAMLAGTAACGFHVSIGDTKDVGPSASAGAQANVWRKYSQKKYGFEAVFPGKPTVDTSQHWTLEGDLVIPVTRYIYPDATPDYIVYVVESSSLGDDNPVAGWDEASESETDDFYKTFPKSLADAQDATASDVKFTKLDGKRAVSAVLDMPDGKGGTFKAESTSIVVKENVITLMTRGDADRDTFTDEFKLL